MAKGDTSSEAYIIHADLVEELEKEIGDYDGNGLDYDGKQYMELPKEIFNALKGNITSKVLNWLGSPVDKRRLSARSPDYLNSTLVHLAIDPPDSDLLSILLQYGADVNVLNSL